ncbi:hypothetical protein WN51_06682 [Melipona quadrifasciata]|uniref:Uncharacterized protein n=1 Tax=Melipona quadrifasciata TaxID=166423 RepID=A0A0M9ACD4_9HYME|nr:hypothetical protein WN51_06682 [Melipona quadrifasciata]
MCINSERYARHFRQKGERKRWKRWENTLGNTLRDSNHLNDPETATWTITANANDRLRDGVASEQIGCPARDGRLIEWSCDRTRQASFDETIFKNLSILLSIDLSREIYLEPSKSSKIEEIWILQKQTQQHEKCVPVKTNGSFYWEL